MDPLPAPLTARAPAPRSGSGRPRRSATRETSVAPIVELPDLNLKIETEDVPLNSEPVISEKSKGKQPAVTVQEPSPEPVPASVHRATTPPAIEPLSAYTCPICFGPPSYPTLTPCGHVCCGECLFAAINTAAQRSRYTMDSDGAPKCPVCRAVIPGWDGKGGGVIGLKPRVVYAL